MKRRLYTKLDPGTLLACISFRRRAASMDDFGRTVDVRNI